MEFAPHVICSICQETLCGEEGQTVVATPCGHIFHKDCLVTWFERSSTLQEYPNLSREELLRGKCPVCAAPQWLKRCVRIFLSVDDQEAKAAQARFDQMTDRLIKADMELAEAKSLIKLQQDAIVVLTKPTSGSDRVQRGRPPATSTTTRKLMNDSKNFVNPPVLQLPTPTGPVVNSKLPASKSRAKPLAQVDRRRPGPSSSMTLRSTTANQRFAAPTVTSRRVPRVTISTAP